MKLCLRELYTLVYCTSCDAEKQRKMMAKTMEMTIMVTHNLDDLRHAHQILYMKDGKIVESGTYQSLCLAKGEFFKQTQARVEKSSGTTGGGTTGTPGTEQNKGV